MSIKKISAALLFPHPALIAATVPVSAAALVYSMLTLPETHPVRIGSYVLAFYALTLLCLRVPLAVRFLKRAKDSNRYLGIWAENPRLRINITLGAGVLWNGAYAVLQLATGIYHSSSWFYSLFAYYALLACMRAFLVWHTARYKPGENIESELKRYRVCGIVLLVMTLALSAMMLIMIRDGRELRHHEITTIAMAAYTFTSLITSAVNVIRYRKYNSPAMSAAKVISLAAACVSLLTLENTMLNTFGSAEMTAEVKTLYLALSGGAIFLFIAVAAIYMIINSNKKLKYSEE